MSFGHSGKLLPVRRTGVAPQLAKHGLSILAGGKGLLHVDPFEPDGGMRLQLSDQVHVGGNDGAEGEIAATGNGIAVQDNRLGPARHLDGAIGIPAIDDVRRICTSPEGLFARDEFKRPPALEAIAHPVGFGRNGPFVLEEAWRLRPRSVDASKDREARSRAGFSGVRRSASGTLRPSPGALRTASRQLVPRLDRTSLDATEQCADRIGRAAAGGRWAW